MQRQDRDPHEVLGLEQSATRAEIRAAYLRWRRSITPTRTRETRLPSGSSRKLAGRMRRSGVQATPGGHATVDHSESVPGNPTLEVSGRLGNRNVSVGNERSMVVSEIDMNSSRATGLNTHAERVRSGTSATVVGVAAISPDGNMASRVHRSTPCLQRWLTFLRFLTGSMISSRGSIHYVRRWSTPWWFRRR